MSDDAYVRFRERTTALFYLMLRDLMPYGALAEMVERVAGLDDPDMSQPELERLARSLAARLGDPAGATPMNRDWLESIPSRTRNSPHFNDVMAEVRERGLPLNDATKQMVIEECVGRERQMRVPDGRIVGSADPRRQASP